jgi:hypothetical protein
MNGDQSGPVVTSTGVYVSYARDQTYDFAPMTGNLIWHHSTFCEGGGGRTPVLYNGTSMYGTPTGQPPRTVSFYGRSARQLHLTGNSSL